MSAILHTLEDGNLMFFCPGCKRGHKVWIKSAALNGATWTWNGSMEKPTFGPSIKVTWVPEPNPDKPMICHSNVTDGNILFHGDSTHALAGQTVALESF